MRHAVFAFALLGLGAALGSAHAETIVKERFGCHAQEVTDRLFLLVQAGDESGFDQLLRVSLASGECKSWKSGETVTVQARTAAYGCLAPKDTGEKCYWTPMSAIDAAR